MSGNFPTVRTISNINKAEWSDYHGISFPDPSLAVQSQKEESDINTIVRNFGVTGKVPQGVRVPMYGDFTEALDYQQSLDAIREAESAFLQMPSELRKRLDNDPQKFLEWCADKGNHEEMRKLGLMVPAATGTPPSGSEAS